MAKNLTICRQHEMGHDECREVAQKLLDKLVNRMGGSVSCIGDDYQYTHSTGIKAIVEPRAKELSVNVKLGLLTSSLAPKLDTEIDRVLDDYLGATR